MRTMLQWGHGDEAVEEVKSLYPPDSDYNGFNGATAMKPWKRQPSARYTTTNWNTLQWGHGDEAVEEAHGASRAERQRASFNGATAMKPWKRSRRRPRATALWRSFNGATAMKPWKRGPPPGPFGAKDLGPGLREGRPAGVSKRSRARAMKS